MKQLFTTLGLLIALSADAADHGAYIRINKEMFSGYLYCVTTNATEQRFKFLDDGTVVCFVEENVKTNVYRCWPAYQWRILGTKTLVLYDSESTNVLRFKSVSETNAITTDGLQFTRQKVQQRGADGSQPFRLLSDPQSAAAGSHRSR